MTRYYKVSGKQIDILKQDWDILVILDACRYDIFKEEYKEILGGRLKKAITPATFTVEWLNKIFNGVYLDDTVYISGTVFNNSQGICPIHKGYRFDGRKHFKKVIDVWDWGWDYELGTVHPKEMNKAALVANDLHRNKRLIIHYMQPHSPYLCYGGSKRERGDKRMVIKTDNPLRYWLKEPWKSPLFTPIRKVLKTDKQRWTLGGLLGALPDGSTGDIFYRYGRIGLIRGYRENLKLVLEYLKKLIEISPNKNYLITADHGERLLEEGNFGHGGARDREVVEVPWLELEV
ncbi:MAG: hypothetical protein ACP5EK_00405 [Thermoplasmatota archaeon]